MNLTDVEKAVVELSSRHPGITKEFLRTLLDASGWEKKHIDEAEIILSARLAVASSSQKIKPPLVSPVSDKSSDAMTFFHPDGSEEGDLVLPETVATLPRKEKETLLSKEGASEMVQPTKEEVVLFEEKVEPQMEVNITTEKSSLEESLIPTVFPGERKRPQVDFPENLPLVPFESSPHVWSFGRYKDTFHPEVQEENKVVLNVPTFLVEKEAPPQPKVAQTVAVPLTTTTQNVSVPVKQPQEVEVDFEKTPITKGDESLVVLAGVMLLAIMLILGYMYGNGRL
ncbi:MAG: hypothetical protein KBC21_01730 [Candidatus Pacebacteria bacterium]|nr:hypothetical protein [Candidatus Paceibacterota bacterium]